MKLKIIAISAFLTGCALDVTPAATGGSQADGTVVFTYTYGALRRPQVNWNLALSEAVNRCNSWGFSSATAFAPAPRECIQEDGAGCVRFQVTRTYQCGE